MTDISRPYECTVHIALPSIQYSQHLKDIISVDEEISKKVVKSFSIVTVREATSACVGGDVYRGISPIVQDGDDDERRVLRM
jgi:hypothetical protein